MRLSACNDYDNYPEEALEKEKIGGMEFNVEKIISLQPDLVLAHGGTAMEKFCSRTATDS